MNKGRVLLFVFLLLMSTQAGLATAKKNQKFNSSSGCGCHSGGAGGVTPVLSGLPSTYTPGSTYSLSIGMTGNPLSGGFNIEVSKGALSNPGTAAQVSSNGFQATHTTWTSTSWTVDWTAPSSGAGAVQVDLAVLHGNGQQTSDGDLYGTSSTTLNEEVSSNAAPSITNLALTPETPTTSDDITAAYTFSDDDGDPESGTSFAWHLNGVHQPAHTATVLPASATTRGDAWYVVVTPSDGVDDGAPETSNTLTVVNSLPVVTSIGVSSETPDTNDDVTFTFATDDDDGDPVTTEVRWLLDGSVVESMNQATTLPALATRPGDVWSVELRASDGFETSGWFSSPDLVIDSSNQAPTVSDLALNPMAPTSSDDLTLTWTEDDGDGDAIVDREIIWKNGGIPVAEANGMSTLPSTMTTKGEVWTVNIRVSDGLAWSLWAEMINIVIENAPPTVAHLNLTSASFSSADDLHLSFEVNDHDGDSSSISTVAWYRNGTLQSGAGNSTTLSASHLVRGDAWHAVASFGDGESTVQATTPSIVVLNAVPQITVIWDSNSTALAPLEPMVQIVDADDDDVTTTYAWYKNGFRDAALANITAVPAEKLAPGQTWTLEVEASDGASTADPVQSTFTVPNLLPRAEITLVSSNVWFNEETVLSAESSTDLDGEIVTYRWTMDGLSASGAEATFVLTSDETVTLTVTDNDGDEHSTTIDLVVSIGPSVQDLQLVYDGEEEVTLAWTWTGESTAFNVLRNGVVVGTTNETAFVDLPPISGTNTYTVQPQNDERVFINGADSGSILTSVGEVKAPAPSDALGFVLGGVLLLALAFLQWRVYRGGGRS